MTWAMKEKGYSQRRACGLVDLDPRVFRYRSTRGDDVAIRTRLKELASQRRRFGYRRLHILLKREGVEINWKKVSGVVRPQPWLLASRHRPMATGHQSGCWDGH